MNELQATQNKDNIQLSSTEVLVRARFRQWILAKSTQCVCEYSAQMSRGSDSTTRREIIPDGLTESSMIRIVVEATTISSN